MDIKYLELKRVTAMYAFEIQEAVSRVVSGGWYLQGEANRRFEEHYAAYNHARYCVGCANGLDALTLTLRAYMEMGVMEAGDEVVVPANTYIATILAITENGLKAVLVEPRLDTFQIDDRLIEEAITPRTKALMLVNLYGRNAFTPHIADLCRRHHLRLLIDHAQGHGLYTPSGEVVAPGSPSSPYHDTSIEVTLCHSFYPGKNLGALGDGGAVTTDNEQLATLVRTLANYGSARKYVFDYCGRNSRLDEIQAAVLDVKLQHLDDDNRQRRLMARRLIEEVNHPLFQLPSMDYWQQSVFHIFPVLCPRRDALQQYLSEAGIQTLIHYPIPPHLQQCYRQGAQSALLRLPVDGLPLTESIHQQEISLPCSQVLTEKETDYLIQTLRRFANR